jgi:hypothetical protein
MTKQTQTNPQPYNGKTKRTHSGLCHIENLNTKVFEMSTFQLTDTKGKIFTVFVKDPPSTHAIEKWSCKSKQCIYFGTDNIRNPIEIPGIKIQESYKGTLHKVVLKPIGGQMIPNKYAYRLDKTLEVASSKLRLCHTKEDFKDETITYLVLHGATEKPRLVGISDAVFTH